MKQAFSCPAPAILELLRNSGFRTSPSSADHESLRHPHTRVTLTIPNAGCPLGRKIMTRILMDSALLSSDVLLGILRSSVEMRTAGESALTELERVERDQIVKALSEAAGNKAEAAKKLGIGRQTLYNKIKIYQIEVRTSAEF
jgi:transcriptional regulator with GAF, ATPase, and Fis domain